MSSDPQSIKSNEKFEQHPTWTGGSTALKILQWVRAPFAKAIICPLDSTRFLEVRICLRIRDRRRGGVAPPLSIGKHNEWTFRRENTSESCHIMHKSFRREALGCGWALRIVDNVWQSAKTTALTFILATIRHSSAST